MASAANVPIYLDYNATTPLDPQVQKDVIEALELWRNPSSSYSTRVKEAIDDARKRVGAMINVQDYKKEIIFTSGGTEANNWILFSAADIKVHEVGLQNGATNVVNGGGDHSNLPHIIASNIEHDAIKFPIEELVKKGRVTATFIPVETTTGAVDVDKLLNEIKPNTVLITLMLANNETGVIQPVGEIGTKLILINESRIKSNFPKIMLHSDAAQAIGKIPVDVQSLHVDAITIVGHKFYGPRIGALYVRDGAIKPLFFGGGQESGLRPGTENTPCIVGLGSAADLVFKNLDMYHKKFSYHKEYFVTKVKEGFTNDEMLVNFDTCHQLPNTISVSVIGSKLSGKEILAFLSDKLHASTGSACHSNFDTSIHSSVLSSSGLSQSRVQKTIRLSLGRETTMSDLDRVVKLFREIL